MKTPMRVGEKDRDILAAKWEIEYEDVFHFKNLYKLAYGFLDEDGWEDPDGGKNWEKFYYEKELPHGAKEYRIWWRVIKNINNPYVRYMMKIDYLGLNFEKDSTVVDGVKYSTWKGNPIIKCEAYVQLDYDELWKKSSFLKVFESYFRKRIYKPLMEQHKKILQREAYKFNREIKVYLGLKTHVDELKPYREVKGTPV